MIISFQKTARIASVITHPLLTPIYLFSIFAISDFSFMYLLPTKAFWIMFFIIIFTTIGLPLFFWYLIQIRNKINNIETANNYSKLLILLISSVFYYLLYYIMKTSDLLPIYYLYILIMVFVIVTAFLISVRYHICLYSIAAGSMAGYIAGLAIFFHYRLTFALAGIIIYCGIAGSSRLLLNMQKPSEVYSGFLFGATLLILVLVLIPR